MAEAGQYNPQTRWTEKNSPQDLTGPEESIFYTALRQPGATVDYIDFHLKPGRHHTVAAQEVQEMLFDPELGIVLFFRSGRVWIRGRNLKKLHQLLCQRRVSEVREFSEKAELFFDPEVLFIKSIEVESEFLRELGW